MNEITSSWAFFRWDIAQTNSSSVELVLCEIPNYFFLTYTREELSQFLFKDIKIKMDENDKNVVIQAFKPTWSMLDGTPREFTKTFKEEISNFEKELLVNCDYHTGDYFISQKDPSFMDSFLKRERDETQFIQGVKDTSVMMEQALPVEIIYNGTYVIIKIPENVMGEIVEGETNEV